MGGQYEDKVEPTTTKKADKPKVVDEPARDDLIQGSAPKKEIIGNGDLPRIPDQVQAIRWHQSGKDIHFHVDEEKLKSAIPVAQLESFFYDLRNLKRPEHRYYDDKNKSLTLLKAGLNNKGQLDIWITVTSCDVAALGEGQVVQKLDKLLTSASRKKGK